MGSYLHHNLYYYVAILIEKRYSAIVKNNIIIVSNTNSLGHLDKPVLAIDLSQPTAETSNQYQQVFDVSNNNIEFSTGILNLSENAPSTSSAFYLSNIFKANLLGNSFKVDNISYIYNMFTFANNISNINIQNSFCYMTSFTNHFFFKLADDNAKVSNSFIINNKTRYASKPNLNNVSNIVDYNDIFPVNRTPVIAVSSSWANAFKIYSQYSNPVLIKLEALVSFNGIKIIDSLYRVTISEKSVSFEPIYNNNSGIDVQFVHTEDNYATCQIKSDVAFNTVVDITKFRPLVLSQQHLAN